MNRLVSISVIFMLVLDHSSACAYAVPYRPSCCVSSNEGKDELLTQQALADVALDGRRLLFRFSHRISFGSLFQNYLWPSWPNQLIPAFAHDIPAETFDSGDWKELMHFKFSKRPSLPRIPSFPQKMGAAITRLFSSNSKTRRWVIGSLLVGGGVSVVAGVYRYFHPPLQLLQAPRDFSSLPLDPEPDPVPPKEGPEIVAGYGVEPQEAEHFIYRFYGALTMVEGELRKSPASSDRDLATLNLFSRQAHTRLRVEHAPPQSPYVFVHIDRIAENGRFEKTPGLNIESWDALLKGVESGDAASRQLLLDCAAAVNAMQRNLNSRLVWRALEAAQESLARRKDPAQASLQGLVELVKENGVQIFSPVGVDAPAAGVDPRLYSPKPGYTTSRPTLFIAEDIFQNFMDQVEHGPEADYFWTMWVTLMMKESIHAIDERNHILRYVNVENAMSDFSHSLGKPTPERILQAAQDPELVRAAMIPAATQTYIEWIAYDPMADLLERLGVTTEIIKEKGSSIPNGRLKGTLRAFYSIKSVQERYMQQERVLVMRHTIFMNETQLMQPSPSAVIWAYLERQRLVSGAHKLRTLQSEPGAFDFLLDPALTGEAGENKNPSKQKGSLHRQPRFDPATLTSA